MLRCSIEATQRIPCLCCKSSWLSHFRQISSSLADGKEKTHYAVLGISHKATQEQIKSAFVEQSKKIHPDRNPNDPGTHDKFVTLNHAYSILSRPQSRKEYDVGLAAHFQNYRAMAGYGYGTHNTGSSTAPGSTSTGSYEEGSRFWDETIYEMRDRSKDKNAYYGADEFYGVKGVHKLSNMYIIAGCFIVMGLGALLHLGAFRYSQNYRADVLDEQDRRNLSHLRSARERAKQHGNVKQLELLKERFQEKTNR